jgi:hypothetical protein
MSQPLDIIIVEKTGTLKLLSIKDFKMEELYKKCGFKKGEDFLKQTEWSAKYDNKKYFIEVYAKTDGRPNSENKYDFPPPIDNTLFFGSCAILAYLKNEDKKSGFKKEYINLSVPLWLKIYEKLFGGFEDLAATALEDEQEEDELANVPDKKKTKQGYLKDGFVVDNSDDDNDDISYTGSDESELDDTDVTDDANDADAVDNDIVIEDIGSELSEDEYDYDD